MESFVKGEHIRQIAEIVGVKDKITLNIIITLCCCPISLTMASQVHPLRQLSLQKTVLLLQLSSADKLSAETVRLPLVSLP